MERKGWWSEKEDAEYKKVARQSVLKAFSEAEKVEKPKIDEMFTDVYDELPPSLKAQKEELERIMTKYPEFYDQKGYST